MNKLIQCVLICSALGISSLAQASTPIPVIGITTDAFTGSLSIDATRDTDGSLTEISYNLPNGQTDVLTLAALEQGPQLIFSSGGHDVIYLSAQSGFNAFTGGYLVMKYLQSGIDGSYKDFRMAVAIANQITVQVSSDPTDPDSDGNSYSGVFNHLFLEKNTFLGNVIGIKDVVPSNQAQAASSS